MIKFFQKLIIILEKKKFLTLLQMESAYLQEMNISIIERNIDELRTKIREMRNKTKQSTGTTGTTGTAANEREIAEIEAKINETEKYRQMIETSKVKEKDIKAQLRFYIRNLW